MLGRPGAGLAVEAEATIALDEKVFPTEIAFRFGLVPEGQPETVEIIAVDPEGRRVAAKGLRWELLRESWQYD